MTITLSKSDMGIISQYPELKEILEEIYLSYQF